MSIAGCPEENGFAERLMRTIKEEHIPLTDYPNLNEVRSQIGQFLTDVYQTGYIHSSLGYLMLIKFETAYAQKIK